MLRRTKTEGYLKKTLVGGPVDEATSRMVAGSLVPDKTVQQMAVSNATIDAAFSMMAVFDQHGGGWGEYLKKRNIQAMGRVLFGAWAHGGLVAKIKPHMQAAMVDIVKEMAKWTPPYDENIEPVPLRASSLSEAQLQSLRTLDALAAKLKSLTKADWEYVRNQLLGTLL